MSGEQSCCKKDGEESTVETKEEQKTERQEEKEVRVFFFLSKTTHNGRQRGEQSEYWMQNCACLNNGVRNPHVSCTEGVD